ncbi:MAG: DeoR/GlpR transcriptional regulator [Lachnospiraceae bacterium]|nr:DeoR/GlpR transcriptional regulator [Lachnospiraceae bacterium]
MDAMEQRRNTIVDLVNQSGNISFAQLKKKIPQISDMTLRTDLKALDEAKRIVRVHGGAKSVDVVIGTDDMLSRRSVRNIEAKQLITQKALQFIRKDTTIFLDSGSTTTMLASCMPDQSNLIYTNSLTCAVELGRLTEPFVHVLGGKMNRYSMSVCGIHTVQEVQRINFDQAFMGVTSYCEQTGFNCGVDEEAVLKKTVMQQAEQKILLMDSSKIGVKNTYTFCGLSDVDIIISDDNLSEEFQEDCRKHGIQII